MKTVALAAALAASLLVSQKPTAPSGASDAEIRQILATRVKAIAGTRDTIGIAVGIVDPNGRRIMSFGRTGNRHSRPLTGDTEFEIGSVGKLFTALLLSTMAQDGEVALTDPAAKYMPPGTALPDHHGRQISLADLATHTAGLPFMPDTYPVVGGANTYGPGDLYRFLARYRLTRDPGTDWEYSNIGYWLLGEALAHRAGMPISALLRTRVFQPLNMRSTTTDLSGALEARLAEGHDASLDPAPPLYGVSIYSTVGAAAGGIYSTADDLLTFLAAAGGLNHSSLQTSLDAMLNTRRPIDDTQQALGWVIEGKSGSQYFFHEGGTWGYASAVAWDPTMRRGVVVLSNQQGSVADIARHLLRPDVALEHPAPARHASVRLPSSVLGKYPGQYKADDVGTFTVLQEGGRLILQVPVDWGLPRFELHPETAREFFVKEMPIYVTFQIDAKGMVTGAMFYPPRGQRGIPAVRIG